MLLLRGGTPILLAPVLLDPEALELMLALLVVLPYLEVRGGREGALTGEVMSSLLKAWGDRERELRRWRLDKRPESFVW